MSSYIDEMVEQIFNELDVDHNGQIDAREIGNRFQGKFSEEEID